MTLRVNNLTGFGGGGGPINIISSVAALVDENDTNSHTMGNIDVGSASGDRNAILGVTMSDDLPVTITSVTVGGEGLTEKETVTIAGSPDITAAIWAGDVSGVSGSQSIVVGTSGNSNSVIVSGAVVSSLNSLTPTMTAADTGANNVTTLTALAGVSGGLVIACSACENRIRSATWEALTERADQVGGGFNDHAHSAAWDLGNRAAADEDTTWTGSGSNAVTVGAGFR